MTDIINVHIGYESVTDDTHRNSPHMRQRLTGLTEAFPGCVVAHKSATCNEALCHCDIQVLPHIAVISLDLPGDVTKLATWLSENDVRIVILYKENFDKGCFEELLMLPNICAIDVKNFKFEFPAILSALSS